MAALYQYLRDADMPQVARVARSCARMAAGDGVTPLQSAALLVAAAAGARSLGELSAAQDHLAQANAVIPSFSGEMLAQLKREEIRLLLDAGEIRAARLQAELLGCTVIERGLATPLVTPDKEKPVDDLLLQAEVALVIGATDEADELLETATRRLEETRRVKIPRSQEVSRQDRRDYLRILQALSICRRGDAHHGLQLLEVTQGRMEFEERPNRVLLARCQAATGAWVEVDANPPAGINVFEARRWQGLSRPAPDPVPFSVECTDAHTKELVPAAPPPPVFLPPGHLDAYAAHLNETVAAVASGLTTQFGGILDRLAAQAGLAPGRAPGVADGAVYGGKFPHIDLASVIVQTELQRETGYVRVSWNPASVETTILSGRLSELARCGVGYVWVCDGNIVDATVCDAEPPPAESADERAALDALTCLLQIGVGVGLDHAPEGQAFCYPDERARERHARIRIPPGASQNLMQSLIVERETLLGRVAEPDIIGEWEKD